MDRSRTEMTRPQRANNVRTAVVLLTVALALFVGVIIAHAMGVGERGLAVIGLVIAAFLVIAIGRNVVSRR